MVVVLDVDVRNWAAAPVAAGAAFDARVGAAVDDVVVFGRAFMACDNKLTFVVFGESDRVRTVDVEGLKRATGGIAGASATPGCKPMLASALHTALLILNKEQTENPNDLATQRLLVLNAGDDDASSYVALMNAAFASQRLTRLDGIDVLDVSRSSSVVLAQMTKLTGGRYVCPGAEATASLYPYLSACYFDTSVTNPPVQPPVDMRATCFCHGKPVDVGFVCTACLAVSCERTHVCATCNTKVLRGR